MAIKTKTNKKDPISKLRKSGGFTIVEVLIVAAILGILVAISLPLYQRFSLKAKRTEGVTILSGFHQAVISYYATDEHLPVGFITNQFPSDIGYALASPANYYWVGTGGSPYYYGYPSESEYYLMIRGQLDGDTTNDYLCIQLINSPASDYCNMFGANVQNGEVGIISDDILG